MSKLRFVEVVRVLGVFVLGGAACDGGDGGDGSEQRDASQAGDAAEPREPREGGGPDRNDAGERDGSTAVIDAGAVEPADADVSDDAAQDGGSLVELPPDSRELDHVVNFVDEAAASELETFMGPGAPEHIVLRQGLARSVNLFLEHYEERYDFLFVFTDHTVTSSTVVGKFEAINRRAEPGGVSEIEIANGGYKTDGTLRAVIGVQWRAFAGPPLSHEITHYWAVDLDERFGFGTALDMSYGAHWGFTSVHGQLGGFDGATLRCANPAGALPPACTPESSGRTRYVTASFFPNSNPLVPYAPLELYLMGLVPASEVPASFQLLVQASEVERGMPAGTVTVEADGIQEIAFADIRARHGDIALRPESERHFTAAFIVVSAQPASDDVMSDVAEWAAAFGNRGTSVLVDPFETLTGGRATLSTELGPRRSVSSEVPPVRERFVCDALAQDCGRPELACYGFSVPLCALSGQLPGGAPCDAAYACAPGFNCFSGPDDPELFTCNQYCDPNAQSGPLACSLTCDGYLIFQNDEGEAIGAICPS